MYMWTSYKAFPSLKKNKYVLNAHETKPYKIIKEKPHYCCSSSWDHCKPSAMKITCTKFQMLLIINDKKASSYRVIKYRKKIFTNIVFFKYICNSNYLPLQHENIKFNGNDSVFYVIMLYCIVFFTFLCFSAKCYTLEMKSATKFNLNTICNRNYNYLSL